MDKKNEGIEQWNHGLYDPLKKTLEYAQQNIPYYSSRIKNIKGQTIADLLQCVPILDKNTAIDHLQELRKDNINQPGRISTGTLRKNNRFMDVQYIEAEDDAIQCFYRNNKSWLHAYQFDNFKSIASASDKLNENEDVIVLRVLNAHYEIPRPQPNTISLLWSSHANAFEIIQETLIKLKHINFFEIESTTLIKLTIMLEQRQFNFNQINIDTIILHGFLSNHWRNYLFNKWHCNISETFSLSEMRAKAYLCTNHDTEPHFHFEPLPVVTEVLHPKTKKVIDSGSGLLVLTPLYPFTQQQLLLRYITQDVIKIISCTEKSTLGFSWCGRERDVVFLDENDSHSSFGLRELIECLDKYYEIARSTDDFEALGIIEPGSVGWPLCKIETTLLNQVKALRIHIILNYNPDIFPDKTNDLCRKIKVELISANDYLYQHYENIQIEIIPYPPSKRHDLSGWHQNQFQQIIRNNLKT